MLSYPDCSSCDCECGNADFSEANNITESSVNQGISDAQSQVDGSDLPQGIPTTAITDNSFIAPINLPSAFPTLSHPNVSQNDPQNEPTGGFYYYNGFSCTVPPFNCNSSLVWNIPFCGHKSLSYSIGEQWIDTNVIVAATLGYQRLLSGSESLDIGNDYYGVPDKTFLHAPNHFLLSAQEYSGNAWRFFAKPYTETYSQKLNEFNLRQKYFDGVNKIEANI
jgi:hypothetical protein